MGRCANWIVVAMLCCGFGCSGNAEPTASESEPAAGVPSQTAPPKHAINPNTPLLAVVAGTGVGPIRLGANTLTIERLMGAPCEIKTDELCRYIDRGVDFHLVNGETAWIHVQRAERPAGRGFRGEQLEFGFFRGAIPPDIRLGMLPSAVQQFLGKATRVEKVPQPNPTSLVERHYYPGLVAEYDRYKNGNLILGGIRVEKIAQ